jgi:hypothetical protein
MSRSKLLRWAFAYVDVSSTWLGTNKRILHARHKPRSKGVRSVERTFGEEEFQGDDDECIRQENILCRSRKTSGHHYKG